MRRFLQCVLILAAAIGVPCAQAQSGATQQPVVRYHFGDNAAWALPTFDDSAWPIAKDGRWPAPPVHSSGFITFRTAIPIPTGLSGPFAIRVEDAGAPPGAQSIYVNGVHIGDSGSVTPKLRPRVPARNQVFSIPSGVVHPGSRAVVVMRQWVSPASRVVVTYPLTVSFTIDRTSVIETAAQADQDATWLVISPNLIVYALLFLLGCTLFVISKRFGGRQLLLYGLWLVVEPVFLIFSPIAGHRLLDVSTTTWAWLWLLLRIPGLFIYVEFAWAAYQFQEKKFRSFTHGCWAFALVTDFAADTTLHAASWLPALLFTSFYVWIAWEFSIIAASLWALLIKRSSRVIAICILANNALQVALLFEVFPAIRIRHVALDTNTVAFIPITIAITVTLIRQGIVSWRENQELRAEFSAAREVQRHLVPLELPSVSGCRISAAYLPAAEVGGDFYQVLPHPDGSAVIIFGDVSGKGLKAAMTGTLAIGALRSIAIDYRNPGALLQKLNQQLARTNQGGFITCLCARITPNGTLTIANAGHLSPYRNGQEIELDSGLPLGIVEQVEYPETTVQLRPGDRLMLLSDGVIEARSGSGELFGFERTREISGQTAERIAQAAQAFGQEDDITVLTLQFTRSEAALA